MSETNPQSPLPDLSRYYTVEQLVDWMQTTKDAFFQMRARGNGPRAIHIGKRKIAFLHSDVVAWLDSLREDKPGSEIDVSGDEMRRRREEKRPIPGHRRPRDHEGMSITQRLQLLEEHGRSYPDSTFTKADLRRDGACVWELFPENPAAAGAQAELVELAAELMHDEAAFSDPRSVQNCVYVGLPTLGHVQSLEALLRYLDGAEEPPAFDRGAWRDASLFEAASEAVPALRAAAETVRVRGLLIAELAAGTLPETSALFVRKALDSEAEALRNADITLAARQVTVDNLRDQVVLVLETLRPHYEIAERIGRVREDLDRIDEVIHWPGSWRTAPSQAPALHGVASR